jgi:hypothetical protein
MLKDQKHRNKKSSKKKRREEKTILESPIFVRRELSQPPSTWLVLHHDSNKQN